MTRWRLPAKGWGTFLSADLSRCKFAFGCKINHFLHKCAQLYVRVEDLLTQLPILTPRRGSDGHITHPFKNKSLKNLISLLLLKCLKCVISKQL